MTRPSDHYPRRCGCGHHAATCNWVPVADANARREQARRQARIDKLRAQIDALTALDREASS